MAAFNPLPQTIELHSPTAQTVNLYRELLLRDGQSYRRQSDQGLSEQWTCAAKHGPCIRARL